MSIEVVPGEHEVSWVYDPRLQGGRGELQVEVGLYWSSCGRDLVDEVGLLGAVLLLAGSVVTRVQEWRDAPRLRIDLAGRADT